MVMGAPEAASLECVEMPAPKDYMREKQKNGGEFCAEEIYTENMGVAQKSAAVKNW